MITRRVLVSVISLIFLGSLLLNPQGSTFASAGNGEEEAPRPIQDDSSSSRKKFDKHDIPRALEYMQTYERHDLPPGQQKNDLAPLDVSSTFYVQPILFVASDLVENPANQPAIDETFQLLKRWYSGPLEQNNSGYSFQVKSTVVFHAPYPFDYYKCPEHVSPCDNYNGIWGNVLTEVDNAGFPTWSSGTIHIILVKGAGGWAGGNHTGSSYWPAPGPAATAGEAILGDWALDAISGTTNPECYAAMGSACYQDPQRGAIGHELGHTFGLAHAQDQSGSLMFSWWDFPWDTLFAVPGNDEQGVLRSSLFFSPQACSPDVLVNQSVLPVSVKSGTPFTVSFNVTNYGFCRWAPTTTLLSSVSGSLWGLNQQAVAQAIYPAQTYTFNLPLKAPSLRKSSGNVTYDCFWQMRIQKKYFGPRIGSTIMVIK